MGRLIERRSRWLARLAWWDFAAAIACAVAIWHGLQATRGLRWPYDQDHYRDISQAQSTLDGSPLADPFYAREYAWYNPLTSWTIATGSALTGLSPTEFHVRAGPWLNIITPAGFYALNATLLGRPAAFAATTSFLFLTCGNEASWACATYSPWLFPANLAHGIFYLTVIALARLRPDHSKWRFLAAGSLAGVTFLAHTAPTLVLIAIFAGVVGWRRPSHAWLLYIIAALVIAAPFLWSILWHYRLTVLNPVPMEWRYDKLTPAGLPGLLQSAVNVGTLMAAIGLFYVLKNGGSSTRLVVLSWGAGVVALVGYRMFRDYATGLRLIGVVPTIHFWAYLLALKSVLIGAGCWATARYVRPDWLRPVLIVAVLAGVVWWRLPQYRRWPDLQVARYVALAKNPSHDDARRVLRRTSSPDDVYLAPYGAGMEIVGPAGRKTVAVNAFFSNPYVDYNQRAHDRERMFDLIRLGNDRGFYTLAAKYRVTQVIGLGPADCAAFSAGGASFLLAAHQIQDVCVFELRKR
jgi:hypothetical protein